METEENAVNASLVVFDEDSENFVETNDSTTTLPILKMADDYENSKKSKRKSVRFSDSSTSTLKLWEKQSYYRNSFNLALSNEQLDDEVFVK